VVDALPWGERAHASDLASVDAVRPYAHGIVQQVAHGRRPGQPAVGRVLVDEGEQLRR
jgi:hypothetical protein